jgi:hypothetical protein
MRFRKLRIAWSVVCGVVYLLTLAWWMGSYQTAIHTPKVLGKQPAFQVVAYRGSIEILRWRAAPAGYSARTPSMRIPVPFLAIVLPLAVGIFVPWVPWSKRFSLRTLLIATTLVAVVLGLVVSVV